MVYPALIAAAAVLGTLVMRPLGVGTGIEGWLYRLLTGFGLCALIAMLLGSYALGLTTTTLYVIAAAGLLWEISRARRSRDIPAEEPASSDAPLMFFDFASVAAITAALLLALLSALTPVTSWDAGVAHLALPAAYAREGRILLLSGNVYSGYPHLLHSLYAVAYFSGGEQTVTLVNWTFGALACLAAYTLGKRIENRRCGLAAAALLATAPIFMDQAGTAAIDLGFTAMTTAALAALVAWFDERRTGWLALSAVLAGSACGVRHTGYVVCLLLCAGILCGGGARRFRGASVFAGLAALVALPWLARSAVITGNPVFPLLLSVFPTQGIEHIDVSSLGAHESVRDTGGVGLVAFLRFPWDIIMRPHLYDGWTKSPGGMVLALGIPGLLLGGRRARALGAFSIAGSAFFFFFQRLARYILPFFIPMMAVAAIMTNRARWMWKGVAVLLTFAFAYGLVLHAAAIHFKIPVLLGNQTREGYLRERVERFPVFEYVNRYLAGEGVILTPDQRTYYIQGRTFQNHWAMRRVAGLDPDRQREWLHEHGIRYVLAPWTYLEESGAVRDALVPMLQHWRDDTAHFRVIKEFRLPRMRGTGEERVDILEFLDGA